MIVSGHPGASTWLAFLVALLASLLLAWPIRRLALRIGMVDRPGPRKVHLKPVPLLGGLAIYSGFVLSVLVTMRHQPRAEILAILAGATLLAATGFLDDSGKLHHQIKLFVSMPLAALILLVSGIHAGIFSPFVPGTTGRALDVLLTLFWVVGITAAFSILDHMDGLCAGIAAVAAAFFILAAGSNGQFMVRMLAAASLGAALGFLRWNFSPARIFMGDGGALLLGFLMATLGLKLRPAHPASPAAWLVPVLILGAPIFDTTLITVSRLRRGLLPFTSPGKDHTAHRLSNLGFGQRRAVLLLYLLGGISGMLGLLLPHLRAPYAYALFGLLVFLSTLSIMALEHSPFERQQKPSRSPTLP